MPRLIPSYRLRYIVLHRLLRLKRDVTALGASNLELHWRDNDS